MGLFPIFVKLEDRPVLVVGAGAVAAGKIAALKQAGARVEVVAPAACDNVRHSADRAEITWHRREFRSDDAAGHVLVFSATGVPRVDHEVTAVCRRQGIACNAVDDPEFCDFYSPAVVRRGDLQIAISTNGRSPALAQQIRKRLEEQFGTEWEHIVEQLGTARSQVLDTMAPGPQRLATLHQQAGAALHGRRWQRLVASAYASLVRWLNTEDETVALI